MYLFVDDIKIQSSNIDKTSDTKCNENHSKGYK